MRMLILIPVLLAMFDAARGDTPRLNILLVLADDLGWSDLQCYGADLHQTPQIDRLAAGGLRFTNAYAASPVCSPTRASILTGKHPARLRMTIWRESAQVRGHRKLLEPIARADLPHDEQTLAEILQQAGYFTAHIGKWHLGSAEFYPQTQGFFLNVGGTLWGAPQTFFYPFRGTQYYRDWRYVPDLEPGQPGDYLTDRLTDRALDLIDQAGDRPFFLNVWYHAVHTPTEGKPKLVARFQQRLEQNHGQPELHHQNPFYAAMVSSLDENVGRLLEGLERRRLSDRTLVVFLSDNGGYVNTCKLHPKLPVTNNAPLRSGKGSLYEGGVRIPMMVRWPGVTRPGATCDQPVYTCDLLPTIVHALAVKVPLPPLLDGIDLVPVLRNQAARLDRSTLFFHYPHYYRTTTPVSALRKDHWKLLEYFEDRHVELYDLSNDLGEQRDLAAIRPELAEQLRQELEGWRKKMGAQLPEPNPAKRNPAPASSNRSVQ